jgi:hypothetical protein
MEAALKREEATWERQQQFWQRAAAREKEMEKQFAKERRDGKMP